MIELLFPGNLTDADELAAHLSLMGLTPRASETWASHFARVADVLATVFNDSTPPVAFFVPGRLEVLGKHTDYAGGRSLIAAVERGFCVAAVPRNDGQVVMIDAGTGQTVFFRLDTEVPEVEHAWAQFPVRVARRLASNFPGAVHGANIVFLGDLPHGGGMCHSRALSTATFLTMAEVNHLTSRDEYWHNIGGKTDLAAYLAAIDNGHDFGTLRGETKEGRPCGGGEDHTAILCAELDHVCQYAYCPIEFERASRVPARYRFAIGFSGLAARTSSGHDAGTALRQQAAELIRLWQAATGREDQHLAEALGTAPDAVEHLREIVAQAELDNTTKRALDRRLTHFMIESSLIPEATVALAAEDLSAFGRLAQRSQEAFENLLGEQMPDETKHLAATAEGCGAVAASGFGFNGGGSVWALVRITRQEEFLANWSAEYRRAFPETAQHAQFFTTAAGPSAFRVC